MIVIKGNAVPSKKFREELARLPVPDKGYFEFTDAEVKRQPADTWQLQEETRPFDWQDRVVITASVIACVVFLALLAGWPV